MRKTKLLGIALLLFSVIAVPIFAYQYLWRSEPKQIQSGITLLTPQAPNMQIGLYWDYNCTNSVTTFDFGEMVQPNQATALYICWIWIRNEGNVTHTIYWNSTLGSITTEITDAWIVPTGRITTSPLNGTTIYVGEKIQTYYEIDINPYTTVGTYNWTLTVWAEYTY